MLTHLYFVRHAHSTYNPNELGRPLSDRGSRDAENMKHLFKNKRVNLVISSPYQRALETVDGIAKYFNKEIEIIDGYKERRLSEIPVVDFDEAITSVWKDWNFSWAGGESNNVAQKRGILATLDILEKHSGKNVVIGTHGNIYHGSHHELF